MIAPQEKEMVVWVVQTKKYNHSLWKAATFHKENFLYIKHNRGSE